MALKTKLSKNQNIFLSNSFKVPCFTKIQWSPSLPFFNKFFIVLRFNQI
jgi:hypothetical protein